MEAPALMDAHVQLKRIYTALNEALDLTRQLADAVDRDDHIAAQMLVSMRQEPIDKLSRARQALDQQRQSLPPSAAARLSAILRGEAAESAEEAPLTAQIGVNQRVLKQLVELDQVVNRKLAREKSIYK
ncbi:MAG: hypothetical protein HFF93_01105 [Oscillibacter sp.]|uniref:hypothetical protein n=1 Tax=Oscillibacter sp. TaxID=1945593 RepID=UPI00216D1B1A|nr:hypothetical protein [Oscillibacter sp.]MCI9113008.1 hypothetical protein [Oscillibacter sp.]MCI9460438.1 hypothetical protein [Oscillibacter sp.]